MNRREGVTGTGRNEDVVAFNNIHVWLDYLNQRPGQVRLLYILHCDHRGLDVSFWRDIGADSM
jgi:hypothetical protein